MARPKKIIDDVGAKVVENPTAEQIAETASGHCYVESVMTRKELNDLTIDIDQIAAAYVLRQAEAAKTEQKMADQIYERELTVALASNGKVYEGTAADAAKIVRLARQIMDASLVP